VLEQQAKEVGEKLLHWYNKYGRRFSWRGTRDPYKILIAEFLLQKTQARTVERHYEEFLKKFPSFKDLSCADVTQVKRSIKSLGLAYRASRLVTIAKKVVERYAGSLPHSMEELLQLRGVGCYTAGAVLCFAFGEQIPLVDTNVMRIARRAFGVRSDTEARDILSKMMPKDRCREFNWALIDLGALICCPRDLRCDECPLDEVCSKHDIKRWH